MSQIVLRAMFFYWAIMMLFYNLMARFFLVVTEVSMGVYDLGWRSMALEVLPSEIVYM